MNIIDDEKIYETLKQAEITDTVSADAILRKARELKGLDPLEIAVLMNVSDPAQLEAMFEAARFVKNEIYGSRLVIFAPLYVSNLCANECSYCAFRAKNSTVRRRALSQQEIKSETEALIDQGHKRVLLVAGESYPNEGFKYILDSIKTVYGVKKGKGEIRRVNVNVSPLTLAEFKQLKDTNIGTYQLFQEAYHRTTYGQVHLGGK